MVLKYRTLSVEQKDVDLLMKECLKVFLYHHPEMDGMKFTQRFMFRKIIEFYLEN